MGDALSYFLLLWRPPGSAAVSGAIEVSPLVSWICLVFPRLPGCA